jgi:Putative gypsy type transposon
MEKSLPSSDAPSGAGRSDSPASPQTLAGPLPWVTQDVWTTHSLITVQALRQMKLSAMQGCYFCPPGEDEPVCASRVGDFTNFFFFYKAYMTRLGVRFPFTEFQMSCLSHLHLAPSQLHPNGWAYIVAFERLCQSFSVPIPCTATLFFFFFAPFTPRSGKEDEKLKGLTSLRGDPDRKLLTAFSDSFKHFKNGFFKVVAKPGQQPWFLKGAEARDVEWRFPLYWTFDHHRLASASYQVMSDDLPAGEVVFVDRLVSYVKTYGARSAAFFITGPGSEPGYVICMRLVVIVTAFVFVDFVASLTSLLSFVFCS